jgi:F0F1-type ATP synthase assembly protein I
MDKDTRKLFKVLGYVSTIGLAMAISIALGAGIGYWLDKKFGTSWLFYVFFGFGVVAAFRNLHIMYKRVKDIFD